jgi:arylsulfatase A-like enzyme
MTDQSSGFARGFDVYDDKFSFKMEDMSRDGNEVTKKATEWIQKQKKPYFAFVHYFDTHFPYTPTQNLYDPDYKGVIDGSDAVLRPYRDGEKTPSARDIEHILALYDAEITELDAKIAPILRLADENTIVVVTSDHGESFSHEYYFNHRAGLWDEITHIPLLISHSEAVKIPQQVGLIDLLPTVLDLAGLPKDERMQGESKVSLLDGKGKGQEDVYSITDPWMKNPQFAVRTKNFKWIQQSNQADLFYALGEDPSEKASLKSVPKEFELKQKQYIDVISAMKEWQVEPPQKRKISDEECKRLMLLGYTTCEKP